MDIFQENCTLLERFPQLKQFWPNPIPVCVMYIARDVFLILEAHFMRSFRFVLTAKDLKFRFRTFALR